MLSFRCCALDRILCHWRVGIPCHWLRLACMTKQNNMQASNGSSRITVSYSCLHMCLGKGRPLQHPYVCTMISLHNLDLEHSKVVILLIMSLHDLDFKLKEIFRLPRTSLHNESQRKTRRDTAISLHDRYMTSTLNPSSGLQTYHFEKIPLL